MNEEDLDQTGEAHDDFKKENQDGVKSGEEDGLKVDFYDDRSVICEDKVGESKVEKEASTATKSLLFCTDGVTPCQNIIPQQHITISNRENEHQNDDFKSSNSTELVDLSGKSSPEASVSSNGTSSDNSPISLAQHFVSLSEDDYENIPTCRICHSDDENEALISPCRCTGTVKYVHQSCFTDWLKRCVKTKCELCLHPIAVNKKPKPLKQWRRPGQKPTPIIWLLTFIVALTLNIASIAKDGSQKCVTNPCIIFYVVGAIGAMLGFAFFYHFLLVSIRYVKQWMALNEDWTLDDIGKQSGLGNANLALSDKSIGTKHEIKLTEVV